MLYTSTLALVALFSVALAAKEPVTFQDLPETVSTDSTGLSQLTFSYDNTDKFPVDETKVFVFTPGIKGFFSRTKECKSLQKDGVIDDGFQPVSCKLDSQMKTSKLYLQNVNTGIKSTDSATFFNGDKALAKKQTLHTRGAIKDAADKVERTADDAADKAKQATDKAQNKASEVADKTKDTASDAKDEAKNQANKAGDKGKEVADDASDAAEKAKEDTRGRFTRAKDAVAGWFGRGKSTVKDVTAKAADKTGDAAESVKQDIQSSSNALTVDSFKIALAVVVSLVGMITLS